MLTVLDDTVDIDIIDMIMKINKMIHLKKNNQKFDEDNSLIDYIQTNYVSQP